MQEAVQLEKRLASKTSSSKALKDLLNSSIAQYNKLVTKKEHRIDGRKKIMVYNLPLGPIFGHDLIETGKRTLFVVIGLRLRAPTGFHQLLHRHYDDYPHHLSGHLALNSTFLLQTLSTNIILRSGCARYAPGRLGQRFLGSRVFGQEGSPKVQG